LESWLGFGKQILPYRYVRRDLSRAGQVSESAISKTKSKSKTFSDHPYYYSTTVVTRVTPLQHPPHAPTSACSQQLRKRIPFLLRTCCLYSSTIIIPLASACVVSVTVHASRRGGPPRGRRGRISSICGAEWRGRGAAGEDRRTYVSYLAPMLWSAGTRIGGHRSRPDLYSALHSPTPYPLHIIVSTCSSVQL